MPLAQNKICSNITFPPTFGTVAAFNLSSGVFNASSIAFQPKPNYVQQTLDFSAVSPLYKAISTYAASKLNVTVTNRGEAHITVSATSQSFHNAPVHPRRCRACQGCGSRAVPQSVHSPGVTLEAGHESVLDGLPRS